MARRISSLRYKPVGWRHESYRHYLASKGISVKKRGTKYFSKGNFGVASTGKSWKHVAFEKGYNTEQILRLRTTNPTLEKAAREIEIEQQLKGKNKLELPLESEADMFSQEVSPAVSSESVTSLPQSTMPIEPVPEERSGVAPIAKIQEPEEPISTVGEPGNVRMTPGVPPPPSGGFDI